MAKRTERSIFAIVGRMNAGKSSVLNVLSGQKDFAIVDSTPGTTTDTVTTVMEIHGVGPCKILDTAGVDETSKLGEKKRKKTFEAIEESDCCIVVLDLMKQATTHDVRIEKELIAHAESARKQVLIVHNVKSDSDDGEEARLRIDRLLGNIHPSIVIDASDTKEQRALATFISTFFRRESREIDLLPSLNDRGFVLLVIPMDEETPSLRLLRPQDMAVERILRAFAIPVLFRMDLKAARGTDAATVPGEHARFIGLLDHLSKSPEGLQLVITDSQAFDIVAKWTPEKTPLTSFSIMMTNYMSFGNLRLFLDGADAATRLRPGDRVLIVEACNHSRQCDDIGTVQLPRLLEQSVGGKLAIDFSFGRMFPEDLSGYKLIVHCGGCMIDRQKYARRIVKAREASVPITNYGVLLAFLHGGGSLLQRAAKLFLTKTDVGCRESCATREQPEFHSLSQSKKSDIHLQGKHTYHYQDLPGGDLHLDAEQEA